MMVREASTKARIIRSAIILAVGILSLILTSPK